jgi:phage tail sheath protein FI
VPSTYTYPGIYIEEIPSGVRTITGVSTSNTAFVDNFLRGPMDKAVRITSLEGFQRVFGDLSEMSEASFAISQYFLNGGQVAWVVRVNTEGKAQPAILDLPGDSPPITALAVRAANPGTWGNNLQVGVDYVTRDPTAFPNEFNLTVREVALVGGRRQVVASETHRNLSMDTTSRRFVRDVVNHDSELIEVASVGPGVRPAETGPSPTNVTTPEAIGDLRSTAPFKQLGDPGSPAADSPTPDADALVSGLSALDMLAPEIFNILCLPAAANLAAGAMKTVLSAAMSYCELKRAFLIVDVPPSVAKVEDMKNFINAADKSRNAAVYFPRLEIPNPLNDNRPRDVGPSGTIAGIFARTDSTRGVWKAPAGTGALVRGASVPERLKLTDAENGALNPFGVNALRSFPIFQTVCWGARTMEGADLQASEWKYIPVRRTALYIEETLYESLNWVVFEPNDEPLWAQIRLNVGAFMHDLFRQGAFQGKTPQEAYFVKCDKHTTTQNDIDRGIVNILVGFAPLKPAEFVVIKLQQIAGQIQT